EKVENMTPEEFEKIRVQAAKEAQQRYGFRNSEDVGKIVNVQRQEEPAAVQPKPTTPVKPPGNSPGSDPGAGTKPPVEVSKENAIVDANIAKMQAQLHVMGAYDGSYKGKWEDSKTALQKFVTDNKIDLKGGSLDKPETQAL